LTAYGKGELLGHQRPRIQHLPDWGPNLVHASRAGGIPPELGSLGREIVDLAAVAGLILDPWQAWIMEQAHVIRPDHRFWNPYTDRYECKWAAFEVGVMVSRQNGKGSILEARELAGLFLFGERLIIHSAHQADTSFEAFERIVHLIEDTPVLDQEVFKIIQDQGRRPWLHRRHPDPGRGHVPRQRPDQRPDADAVRPAQRPGMGDGFGR
jgi:hypothetical protein